MKGLNIYEKAIIEYALRYNSLTVSVNYVGTVPEDTKPFIVDIYGFDNSAFVSSW